jgi:hypothetical protein
VGVGFFGSVGLLTFNGFAFPASRHKEIISLGDCCSSRSCRRTNPVGRATLSAWPPSNPVGSYLKTSLENYPAHSS